MLKNFTIPLASFQQKCCKSVVFRVCSYFHLNCCAALSVVTVGKLKKKSKLLCDIKKEPLGIVDTNVLTSHSLSRSFFFMRFRRLSIEATSDLRER